MGLGEQCLYEFTFEDGVHELKTENEQVVDDGKVWSFSEWLTAFNAVESEVKERDPCDHPSLTFHQWLAEYQAAEQQAWTHQSWLADSTAGRPAAAYCPDIRCTPEAKLFELPDGYTPPRPPKPHAKIQLQVAKRMEQKLKAAARPDTERVTTSSAQKSAPQKARNAGNVKGKKSKKNETTGRNANGPVVQTYKKFMDEKKGSGMSHAKARELWMESTERAELLQGMTTAERKRRRFC